MELVIGVLVVAGLLGCGVVLIFNFKNRSQLVTTKRYRETTTGDRYTIEYRKQSNGTYKIFARSTRTTPKAPASTNAISTVPGKCAWRPAANPGRSTGPRRSP